MRFVGSNYRNSFLRRTISAPPPRGTTTIVSAHKNCLDPEIRQLKQYRIVNKKFLCSQVETLEEFTMSPTKDDSRKRKASEESMIEVSETPSAPDKGKNSRMSRKEARANHTRGWNKEKKENKPHAGSFADETQRKLFNVELPPEEDPEIAATRVKRKVAFLLGYLGTNYSGFQVNEGQRTLQGEFELALLRCHLLMRSNFGNPYKYSWSTSGRTDKGVHACAQVVSAKIELLPNQTLENVRDVLNEQLPQTFRVLDVKRTTRNFCAHTQRDRVRYQYMMPSFVLCHTDKIKAMFEAIGVHQNGRLLSDPLSPEEVAKMQAQLKNFRVTDDQLALLKKALKCYEGTNPYQSFSKGIRPGEARAMRFIEYFRVEDPLILDDGTEWIPTQVLGQSFLIHQIRKMACMAMDVARGAVPFDTITRALSKTSDIIISPAPAQGLYLDMSFYTGYNQRKQSNPDLPDLDWTIEDSDEFNRWKAFRNGVVMKQVAEEESREGNFLRHLFIQEYGFDYDENYKLTETEPMGESTSQAANA